jgi:hypothetical protein
MVEYNADLFYGISISREDGTRVFKATGLEKKLDGMGIERWQSGETCEDYLRVKKSARNSSNGGSSIGNSIDTLPGWKALVENALQLAGIEPGDQIGWYLVGDSR